jgi:apolipoprotein N-acyltransferase
VKAVNKNILAILPGILLYAAWPVSPFTFLIFFALVPLFWLESTTSNSARFFWVLLLNLFIWNTATTWWIWNASPGGAAGAIIANSALMCFPWMLFRFTKKQLGATPGYLSFILYWLSWEYLHHNWELSWPWLTLGNVFSTSTNWVQWYEYTGTAGGTIWILLVNILLFESFVGRKPKESPLQQGSPQNGLPVARFHPKRLMMATFVLAFPIIVSYMFFINSNVKTATATATNNIVVVQPNVEPYTEKFDTDPNILIDRMIALSESQADTNTRMIIWPETAIPVPVWENEIAVNSYYQRLFAFTKKHPRVLLVSGIDSYKNWGSTDPGGFSIRTLKNGDHYEAFNTAFATDSTGTFELYHKSKLVPGVESLPSWLGFMSSIFDDLGGTTGSLGRSKKAEIFSFPGNPYQPAPIICYESIYGDYVADYCRAGANVLTIVTNDGWWGNTPGYKQHMSMARLRAIETRRWVARSANTGISCFIDPYGNVLDDQPWDKASAIKMNIPVSTGETFYVKHGDWLSRLLWPLAIILFLWAAMNSIRKKTTRAALFMERG